LLLVSSRNPQKLLIRPTLGLAPDCSCSSSLTSAEVQIPECPAE